MVKQYHIYVVRLDPTIGSEMHKVRPCIVVSPDEMNHGLRTVIVAPLTTKFHDYPTRIPIEISGKQGWIALDQLRTLDQSRLGTSLGTASKQVIDTIKHTLHTMLVV